MYKLAITLKELSKVIFKMIGRRKPKIILGEYSPVEKAFEFMAGRRLPKKFVSRATYTIPRGFIPGEERDIIRLSPLQSGPGLFHELLEQKALPKRTKKLYTILKRKILTPELAPFTHFTPSVLTSEWNLIQSLPPLERERFYKSLMKEFPERLSRLGIDLPFLRKKELEYLSSTLKVPSARFFMEKGMKIPKALKRRYKKSYEEILKEVGKTIREQIKEREIAEIYKGTPREFLEKARKLYLEEVKKLS